MHLQYILLAACILAIAHAGINPVEVEAEDQNEQVRDKRFLITKAILLGKGALVGGALIGAKAGLIGGGLVGAGLAAKSYGGYGGYGGGYYSGGYSSGPTVYHVYAKPSYSYGWNYAPSYSGGWSKSYSSW